jgi:3-deoxy-D-manno-octulosonate 8-phosphate phosphatase KdsC-like HAD superfamily phosphatase
VVVKKQLEEQSVAKLDEPSKASAAAAKCKKACNEYIENELSTVGDQAVESADLYQVTLKAASMNDMAQLLKRVTYVNKETYPKAGVRSIKLATTLQ